MCQLLKKGKHPFFSSSSSHSSFPFPSLQTAGDDLPFLLSHFTAILPPSHPCPSFQRMCLHFSHVQRTSSCTSSERATNVWNQTPPESPAYPYTPNRSLGKPILLIFRNHRVQATTLLSQIASNNLHITRNRPL